MLDTVDAALGELLEEHRASLPKGITARQFMQMVMRGEIEPTPRQMTAAKVLIEYQEPKLSAVAISQMDQHSFAAALERAILRSKGPPPVAALPAPQHPREEVRKPFTMPRRNFR
jgi:hypothetical protein